MLDYVVLLYGRNKVRDGSGWKCCLMGDFFRSGDEPWSFTLVTGADISYRCHVN